MNFDNLKLFVLDNDDTLMRSSPLISSYVERTWPQFSSEKLKIKERTISIMQYFYNKVENESNFKQFDFIFTNDDNNRSDILNIYDRMIQIVNYVYSEVNNEIVRAKKLNIKPNIPNFNAVRNDVIRGSQNDDNDFEDSHYYRPLTEIIESLADLQREKDLFAKNSPECFTLYCNLFTLMKSNIYNQEMKHLQPILVCIELAKYSKEMFLENRDFTLETDGKKSAKEGKIPYDEIYKEINWFPMVRENVTNLQKKFGDRLVSLTAHNGIDNMHGREFSAKGDAVHSINPDIKHYGQRFHPYEHIPGIRRPRADKGETIEGFTGYRDLRGVVVLEDSLEVLRQIYRHGGTPIFINYDRRPNPDGFAEVHSTKPENIYGVLSELGYGSNNPEEILQKPKTLIR